MGFIYATDFGSLMEELMNDLIVYAGIGILLIGLPVLFARLKATKH
jgi:hypothetical protein